MFLFVKVKSCDFPATIAIKYIEILITLAKFAGGLRAEVRLSIVFDNLLPETQRISLI